MSHLDMDDYQRLHHLLVAAWHADQVRHCIRARTLIAEAVSLVDSSGTASTIAVRILVGAGLIEIEDGAYASATPILLRATTMAKQLGNDVQLAAAAAGLAMAQGRLGNSSEQLHWSRAALDAIDGSECGIITLSAAYERAVALCHEGRTSEAIASLHDLEPNLKASSAPWVGQAWNLVKADIYCLSGDLRRAMMAGTKGTSVNNSALLLNDFAGPFARWKALSAIRAGQIALALEELNVLAANITRLHAKDQAELIASIAMLESARGDDAEARWREVGIRLRKLPITVGTMLAKLGITQR